MTINLSKDEFLKKLLILQKILPSKAATPILTNFLLETKPDKLFITAGNGEGRITTHLECKCSEEIKVCIPGGMVDGLKNLPEQPIRIDVNGEAITIYYQGGKFDFMGDKATSYPEKRISNIQDTIYIPSEDFVYGISKVINLAGNDELRPVMSSVLLQTESEIVNFVATNGHGMAFMNTKVSNAPDVSVIISRTMAHILKNILPPSEPVKMGIGSDWSDISTEDYEISMRNVEGRYPRWKSVIPPNNNLILIADTRMLVSVIKRTLVFANKQSNLIVFNITCGNQLTVSSQNIDFSTSAEEEMNVEYNDTSDFRIGLSGTQLLDILNYISDERVVMTFSDSSHAVLIMPEKQTEWNMSYLLMPMTINN